MKQKLGYPDTVKGIDILFFDSKRKRAPWKYYQALKDHAKRIFAY